MIHNNNNNNNNNNYNNKVFLMCQIPNLHKLETDCGHQTT